MELCFSLQSLPSPFCSHTSFLNVQHPCFLPGPLPLLSKHSSYFDSKAEKTLAFGQSLRSHTHQPLQLPPGAGGEQDLRSCQHLLPQGGSLNSPGVDCVRGALSSTGPASGSIIVSISTRNTDSWVLKPPLGVCSTALLPLTEFSNCEGRVGQGKQRKERLALSLPRAKNVCFDTRTGLIPPQQRKLSTIKLFS